MASIAKWSVDLVANTQGFTSGLAKVASQSNAFTEGIKGKLGPLPGAFSKVGDAVKGFTGIDLAGAAGKLGGVFGPLGNLASAAAGGVGGFTLAAVAAAGALAKLSLDSLNAIANIGKMSERFGIAAESMQGLLRAGEIKGLDAGQIEHGIQEFSKRAGQAREAMATGGSSEFETSLRRIGLNAEQILALPLDQGFERVSIALSRVGNVADRTAIAYGLLGRDARSLVPLISDGEVFNKAKSQLESLGLAVSNADVAAARGATKAVKDAGLSVSSIVTSVLQSVALGLAPVIQFVAGLVSRIVQLIQPILAVFRDTFKALAPVFSFLADVIGMVLDPIFDAISGIGSIVTAIWNHIKSVVVAVFSPVIAVWKAFTSMFKGIQGSGFSLGDIFRAIAKALEWVSKIIGGVINVFMQLWVWYVEKLAAGIQGLLEVAAKLPAWLGGNWFKDAADKVGKFRDELNNLKDEMAGGIDGATFQNFGEWMNQFWAGVGRQARAAFNVRIQLNVDRASSQEVLDEARRLQDVLRGARPNGVSVENQIQRDQEARTQIDNLREQLAVLGMSAQEAERWKLARKGVSEGVLNELRQTQQLLSAAQQHQKIEEEVKKLKEDTYRIGMNALDIRRREMMLAGVAAQDQENVMRALMAQDARRTIQIAVDANPLATFRREMERLRQLAGGSFLGFDDFATAAARAAGDLWKAAEGPVEAPRAILARSSEAVSMINRVSRESQRGDPAERTARAVDTIVEQNRRALEYNRQIAEALIQRGIVQEVTFP